MAILHPATITPAKLDLLAAWLPYRGLERVGACRLDDPAGEVGIELIVVRSSDGVLVHAPLTYRAAPLDAASAFLIGTTEHSVLGTRWVYDAVGDPVFVAEVTRVIRTGGHEAREFLETPAGPKERRPLMTLRGSGTQPDSRTAASLLRVDGGDPAAVLTDVGELSVRRVITEATPTGAGLTLTASWDGLPSPVVLAVLS